MKLNSMKKPLGQVKADVFFFDRVSPASVQAATHFASEGSIVFFEPSGIGDPRLFQKATEIAHVIKYSHQRVREMAELPSRPNPLLEIETLGDEGLRYKARSGNRMSGWKNLPSLGESASAVWKAVQEQHARLLPASPALDEELREERVAGAFNEVVAVDGTAAALVFGARLEKESPRRRPVAVEPDCQLSLF